MQFQLDESKIILVEVQRVLVASTAHITEKDSTVLRNQEHCLITHSYEEGDFVILNDIEEKMSEVITTFSDEFVALILLAQKNRCEILRLDRDGPIYKQLPTFDW